MANLDPFERHVSVETDRAVDDFENLMGSQRKYTKLCELYSAEQKPLINAKWQEQLYE